MSVVQGTNSFECFHLNGINAITSCGQCNLVKTTGKAKRYSKKGCGKLCELKLLNESLKKENVAKDREIRQLNKDAQQYEQTILNLRKEISLTKCTNTPDVSKRDAEVMAGMCCTGTECGDWEPVKDFSEMLHDETLQFQERIQQMESNLKSSSDSVRALRKVNVSLTEEMHAMRRVCAALVEENRAASVRAQFKDDIIREMRRQLKQAKAKLKETSEATELKPKDFVSGDGECPRGSSASYDSVTIACVRAQPRRKRDVPLRESLLHRDATGHDSLMKTDIDHSTVLRGNTVSSNAISDAATCEEMRAYDCGHTQESDDDAFLNRESTLGNFVKKFSNSIVVEHGNLDRILLPRRKTELCQCSVATTVPEEIQTTCACARVCGPLDVTAVERSTGETCSTSEEATINCACERNKGSPSTIERMAVCCQWSALKSSSDEKKVLCECVRDFSGISIIGSPPSPPILISDASNEELKLGSTKCTPFNCPLPKDSSSSCSGPCPGPSTLVSQNSSLPACLDLNISQIGPRSCIKFKNTRLTHKSVQMQIPEVRDNSQECDAEMFNEHEHEGHCNVEECIQNREIISTTPNTSFCQAMKTLVNRSCSEVFKDSSGACSLMDSATGSCEANAQASYYHNKLVSTLQILQNREETIRVQTESLAVAEERISALTERAAELRRDLERKSKEMLVLRQTLECCKVEKVDVSVTARGDSEVEQQSDMMNTLQSNLSVIEDLYRECFYETAKQEDLIDLLRKSYLDVRLMDKQKADQIGRLQNVINAQKLSLDKCQEIALEVDNLKMEISNFLSSSTSINNDSGMWERSEESLAAPEVHEELQEVMEQLLRLRELLNDPCTCGLQNEIRRVKQKNEALQTQTTELWQRNCELEKELQAKGEARDNLEKKYKEEVKTREEQLKCVRRELAIMLESLKDQAITCEQLTMQLRQTEELLGDKSEELVRLQQQYDTQQETIDELKDEAKRAAELCKENCKLRGEVSSLSAQAAQWREQLAASGRRVRKLEAKLRQAMDCYSEKENNASELQLQLEQAHARGAALCGDVRRVLCALRHWARRSRDARREQENTIKEKDEVIAALQDRLESRVGDDMPCLCTSTAEEPTRSAPSRRASRSRLEAGRPQFLTTNENEMATCSSAPTPPRRLFRKKPPYGVTSCKGTRWFCEATQQHPERHDASQDPRDSYCEMPEPTTTSTMGNVSPTDELFRRMENLSDALADGYRRWTKSDAR